MYRIATLITLLFINNQIDCKYLEGVINTSNNWAFLARFCFLSEEGQFEYFLEFDEDQGVPNLLLYYDTEDQWPAIYKTTKTCYEKESVLHVEQNQIINLTTKQPYFREFAGCSYVTHIPTTSPRPKYPLNWPTTATKTTSKPPTIPMEQHTTEETTIATNFTEDFSEYTSTIDANSEFESINHITTTEETITTTLGTKAPIKKRALAPSPAYYRPSKYKTIICHNARRFRSSRERWWFLALSNCNGTKGIHIKYKIMMTNGPPGDYWHEHLSADEFYILPVLMAFSIAYTFLLLGIIMCSIELKSRQLLHTTYKIFVFSALLQFFGIIITSAGYLKYAINGMEPSKVKRTGAVFMGASETLFLLLLLLLAKGFTITRGRLPLTASIKLTIFMCLYVVTYISLFIYEANVFDPGEVLYMYESPAGYGLIILRVLAWCMFIYSTVFTLKHYPEKSNFYYPFNICGTLWFIAGPAFILSANTYIDKWVRESIVCAVLQFITFGGHLSFLILTMPSVANKNFPYHVRTTQIGIMELTGTSAIERFGHHNYEPSGIIQEQTVIVPLTRRTEEIFEGMYSHIGIKRNNPTAPVEDNNAIENVVNWSLARNIAAIEVPHFERTNRSSFTSTISDEPISETHTSRRPSIGQSNGFQDYIREVPVELFTISRMVVDKSDNVANGNV